jgi:hypothetical protein
LGRIFFEGRCNQSVYRSARELGYSALRGCWFFGGDFGTAYDAADVCLYGFSGQFALAHHYLLSSLESLLLWHIFLASRCLTSGACKLGLSAFTGA